MKTLATLPEYLFASDDGSLYDTRLPDWSSRPLRPVFRKQFQDIRCTAHLKATLRAGEWTFPGCYPLYFVTADGEALSFESVRSNLRLVLDAIRSRDNSGWRVTGCQVNYEDTNLRCAHSDKLIPSAYGE